MNEESNDLPPRDPGPSPSYSGAIDSLTRRIQALSGRVETGITSDSTAINPTFYINPGVKSDTQKDKEMYEEAILSIYKLIFLKDAIDAKIAIIEITEYIKKKGIDPAIKQMALQQALKELKEMSENI